MFDRNEEDGLNDTLLSSKIPNFDCRPLKIAYYGKCRRFISRRPVQMVVQKIWKNAIIFTPDRILTYNKNFRHLKILACFITAGLIAPVFQTIRFPEKKKENRRKNETENDNLKSAYRLVNSEEAKYQKSKLESDKLLQFWIRYKNFMYSPRSHFVHETVSYLIFLLIFSYYMLAELKIYWRYDCLNLKINATFNQTREECVHQVIKEPIWIDYLLVIWVFSLFSQEINQLVS